MPATLLEFIEENAGCPWDESTITEDARLIIGQFGLINGARLTTKMVPVYLLEAVPQGETFIETYRSFWRQRQRWAKGSFDEVLYMLRPPKWVQGAHFDRSSNEWGVRCFGPRHALPMRFARMCRIVSWIWDHFLWGIGGFVVLTHWWLVSLFFGSPNVTLGAAGLALLLAMPLLIVLAGAAQLACFMPGGLSFRRLAVLYLQSYVAIWIYCLPVVFTQMACLFGFGSRLGTWVSTKKPGTFSPPQH